MLIEAFNTTECSFRKYSPQIWAIRAKAEWC